MKNFFIENKIIIAIAAAVLILGALILSTGGNDSSDKADPKPEPTVTKTTEPPAPAPEPEPTLDKETREQIFVTTVTNEYPALAGDDTALLAAGYRICDDITNGATLEDFVKDAQADDLDPEMYGFVVGAATNSICPEHADWAEAQGEVSPSNA